MPPKGSAAKGAPPKKEEKPAAPSQAAVVVKTTSVPIATAKTTGMSYLSMLQKAAPAAATPEVKAETSAAPTPAAALPPPKPKAVPQLVDLPASTSGPKKGKKDNKRESAAAEVPVVEAVAEEAVAVPVEEPATVEVETAPIEEPAPQLEEVAPEVIVEAATPLTAASHAAPASPEKLAADEAPQVAIAPSHVESSVKDDLSAAARMNWADVEPGYSTFSNHHLFSGVSQDSHHEVAAAETSSKLVSFRGGHATSHRVKFVAPSNDKVVSSLLQVLRSREEEVLRAEERLHSREKDVQRRESALDQERLKLTNDRQALERERNELSRQQQAFNLQQQQQQQQPAVPLQHGSSQQSHSTQQGYGHHRHAQSHMHHQEQAWDEDQYHYDYQMQQHAYGQPRNYGRPNPRPQGNYSGGRMPPQQMTGYPPMSGYPPQPRPMRNPPMQHQMSGYNDYPHHQQGW